MTSVLRSTRNTTKFNRLSPAKQSQVFPGSPAGWVFPGDKGVPRTLAPTRWNNFAPRFGLAYSFGDHDGALGKLLGKSGASSIRAGYTLTYASFEGATDFNEIGDAPFGNYTTQSEPTFAAPFTSRASGRIHPKSVPGCSPAQGSVTGAPGEWLSLRHVREFIPHSGV